MRPFNFSPGPSALPAGVLAEVQAELLDFAGTGRSIMELSHRSPEYEIVHSRARDQVRAVLSVPDDFEILLLAGGATLQFTMVPLNLVSEGRRAGYIRTGSWGAKAFADGETIADAYLAWDGEASGFTSVPPDREIAVDDLTAYVHMTSNETIGGVQFPALPSLPVPLVVDMSSDIATRPVEWSGVDLAYAGAQKNLGPAGVTVVIIRRSLLDRGIGPLGAYLRYATHAEKQSLYNTPPVFAIYVLDKVLSWISAQGGVEVMEKLTGEKASLIYREIDESGGYYATPVDRRARSSVNVVFRLPDAAATERFLAEASRRGLHGLKGHRSVGGIRVSLYNAVPLDGAEAVAELMREHRAHH